MTQHSNEDKLYFLYRAELVKLERDILNQLNYRKVLRDKISKSNSPNKSEFNMDDPADYLSTRFLEINLTDDQKFITKKDK